MTIKEYRTVDVRINIGSLGIDGGFRQYTLECGEMATLEQVFHELIKNINPSEKVLDRIYSICKIIWTRDCTCRNLIGISSSFRKTFSVSQAEPRISIMLSYKATFNATYTLLGKI